MIDVSKLPGAACPRCVDRRVYQVDENRNMWLCIANAMPAPWRRDQLITHDAEHGATAEASILETVGPVMRSQLDPSKPVRSVGAPTRAGSR